MGNTCCCSDGKDERHEVDGGQPGLRSPPPEPNTGNTPLFDPKRLQRSSTLAPHKVSKVHIEIKLVGDETAGEGIKKTPGYETNLTPSALERWRHDFWGKWRQVSANWKVTMHSTL